MKQNPQNEENKGWLEHISAEFADATHEAYLQARESMDYIVLARDRHIIKLYKDGSFDTIKKI